MNPKGIIYYLLVPEKEFINNLSTPSGVEIKNRIALKYVVVMAKFENPNKHCTTHL
jgi:hypothetical protein